VLTLKIFVADSMKPNKLKGLEQCMLNVFGKRRSFSTENEMNLTSKKKHLRK